MFGAGAFETEVASAVPPHPNPSPPWGEGLCFRAGILAPFSLGGEGLGMRGCCGRRALVLGWPLTATPLPLGKRGFLGSPSAQPLSPVGRGAFGWLRAVPAPLGRGAWPPVGLFRWSEGLCCLLVTYAAYPPLTLSCHLDTRLPRAERSHLPATARPSRGSVLERFLVAGASPCWRGPDRAKS